MLLVLAIVQRCHPAVFSFHDVLGHPSSAGTGIVDAGPSWRLEVAYRREARPTVVSRIPARVWSHAATAIAVASWISRVVHNVCVEVSLWMDHVGWATSVHETRVYRMDGVHMVHWVCVSVHRAGWSGSRLGKARFAVLRDGGTGLADFIDIDSGLPHTATAVGVIDPGARVSGKCLAVCEPSLRVGG
jgi:hypothetical protein